jgi:YggT family protein
MAQILITTIDLFFNLMSLLIIARVLLSWFPQARHNIIGEIIYNVTDPVIVPIQRVLPTVGMFDFSPIVALIALQIVQMILDTALANAFGL